MALLAGLCLFLPVHDGFTNQALRDRVGTLFDPGPRGYTRSRMTYDLRRLRLKGLLHRLPRRNRYVLTPLGRRVALFFTKTYARILRPGHARLDPAMPADPTDTLTTTFRRWEQALDQHIADARLPNESELSTLDCRRCAHAGDELACRQEIEIILPTSRVIVRPFRRAGACPPPRPSCWGRRGTSPRPTTRQGGPMAR